MNDFNPLKHKAMVKSFQDNNNNPLGRAPKSTCIVNNICYNTFNNTIKRTTI